MKEKFFLIMY